MKGMDSGREGEREGEVEVHSELNTHYLVVVCKFSATQTLTIHIIMLFLVCKEKYSTLLNLYDNVIHESISYLTIKFVCTYVLYRVSQKEWTKLWESVPYVKIYRYNPKHLCPKSNGYGDNGQRKVWSFCGSTYCTWFA